MKQITKNQLGFGHHLLLAALVIVIGVASFGTYKLVFSGAESFSANGLVKVSTERGCWLAGREWKGGNCTKQCRAGAGQNQGGYCQNAMAPASSIGQARCINELHRVFVEGIGCSRRVDQDNTKNAPQCVTSYPNYVANGAVDYCKANDAPAQQPAPAPQTTQQPTASSDASSPAPRTTPPASSQPAKTSGNTTSYEAISSVLCQRNGRTYVAGSGCATVCNPSAGQYLKGDDRIGYCSGSYASRSEVNRAKCDDLHRVWNAGVPGCARAYNNVNSENNTLQCQAGFTNYYTGVEGKGYARCTRPNAPAPAYATPTTPAAATGSKPGSATTKPAAGTAEAANPSTGAESPATNPVAVNDKKPRKEPNDGNKKCDKGYHKNKNNKCVKNGVVRNVTQTVGNAAGTVSCTVTRSCAAPAPKKWQPDAAFCRSLGRSYNGNGSCGGCTQTGYERNPSRTVRGYDTCAKKKTSGTKLNTAQTTKESKSGGTGLPQKTVSCAEFVSRYNGPGRCPTYTSRGSTTKYCKREGATVYGTANKTQYVSTKDYLIVSKTC